MIESFHLNEGRLSTGMSTDDICALARGPGTLWVNLQAVGEAELKALLARLLGPSTPVFACHGERGRLPRAHRLEELTGAVFLSPKVAVPTGSQLFTRELVCYLRPRLLITVHDEELAAIRLLRDRPSRDEATPLEGGSAALLCHMIATLCERFASAGRSIEERADGYEALLSRGARRRLGKALDLRASAQALRSIVLDSRSALTALVDGGRGRWGTKTLVDSHELEARFSATLASLDRSQRILENGHSLYVAQLFASQRRTIVLLNALVACTLLITLLALLEARL